MAISMAQARARLLDALPTTADEFEREQLATKIFGEVGYAELFDAVNTYFVRLAVSTLRDKPQSEEVTERLNELDQQIRLEKLMEEVEVEIERTRQE